MKVDNARGHSNKQMQRRQTISELDMGTERIQQKDLLDKQHKKRITKTRSRPEAIIHVESFRAALKKVPNRKTPGHDGIHRF